MDQRNPLFSLRFKCVPLALPVLCVVSCSGTGRASATQRLDSDRAMINAKSCNAPDLPAVRGGNVDNPIFNGNCLHGDVKGRGAIIFISPGSARLSVRPIVRSS